MDRTSWTARIVVGFTLLMAAGPLACVPEGKTPLKFASGPEDAGVSISAPDATVTPPPTSPPPQTSRDAGQRPPAVDAGSTPPPPPPMSTPDAGQPPPPPESDICIDGPNKPLPALANVYYGTPEPTHVPLTPGQILAIGQFNGCTGTVIAPRWVLSADHCGFRRGSQFCVGQDPRNANICFRATQVYEHSSSDMALLQMDEDIVARVPQLEPIALFTDDFDNSWIGETAEASGYGQQENGGFGEREFTAQPIVRLGNRTVTIDGEGTRGVCFGDSGGPLLVIQADGTTRISGVLSNGDGSCVGQDNFTRVDRNRDWIEGYVGPTTPPGPQPCGNVTTEGRCENGSAIYCGTDGFLATDSCSGSQVCGWSTGDNGFRCIDSSADPCQGETYAGSCNGNVLTWCDRGQRLTRDCQACNEACIPSEDGAGRFCLPSDCGDLTFLGRCEGNTAVWCNRQGRRESRNCRNGCGFIDADTGYFCQ